MEKRIFFDAELQQINFLDERFYFAGVDENGEKRFYPSVTHVLGIYPKGPQFAQWLKDVGNSAKIIADRAAEAGSKVHDGIEKMLNGRTLSWGESGENYDLNEWRGLIRFKEFYEMSNLDPLWVEVNAYSHEHKFAGTCDLICRINGETWLIDHKFGNAIYPTYHQQLIAYKKALEEMDETLVIDRVGVLHLKANTRTRKQPTEKKPNDPWQGYGWQLVDPAMDAGIKRIAKSHGVHPYDVIWENFTRTLGIFYYENPTPAPKNETYPAELNLNQEVVVGEEVGQVDIKHVGLS